MPEYIPTIGIETHVQLKTKTKLFSAVDNDARDAAPNTLISHIDVGMPGALPVLNKAALELATRAAFALNTRPQKFSKFDRKHYFYPDLPKGYQISQYDDPIIKGGYVELPDGKKVEITRAHLEEDAGKNTHPSGADYSLVDLNRAGTPLLEIVSEPVIHSAADAKAYVRELYLLMKYAGVSDCDLYLGHMRFDVNISISRDPAKPGKRAEIKNLNSFRSVEAAIEYEIKRQAEILDKGQEVVQETRGWDEAKQKTTSQRGKEEAHDYRYMPEPDIPPIELDDEFISNFESEMPDMPNEWRHKLSPLGLGDAEIETLLEGDADHGGYLIIIDWLLSDPEEARQAAYWQINVEIPLRREGLLTQFFNDRERLEIYKWVYASYKSEKLNSNQAREFLKEALDDRSSLDNLQKFADDKGLSQISNESAIEEIVRQVLAENAKAADDVKNGEMKAIGFLVGQVMAKSKGQANPGLAQAIIKKQLGV